MLFYAAFNIISVISWRQLTLYMSIPGFTSTRLGLGSVLPKDIPMKNLEDPVQLEPRTPGLQVKHFTTEPRRTPDKSIEPHITTALMKIRFFSVRDQDCFKKP